VGSLPCDELRMLLFESLRAGALDTRDGAAYSVASAFRSELVYVKANEEAASPTFGAVHVRLQVALVSPRVTASSGQLQTKCRDVLCMLDQYFGFRKHHELDKEPLATRVLTAPKVLVMDIGRGGQNPRLWDRCEFTPTLNLTKFIHKSTAQQKQDGGSSYIYKMHSVILARDEPGCEAITRVSGDEHEEIWSTFQNEEVLEASSEAAYSEQTQARVVSLVYVAAEFETTAWKVKAELGSQCS